MHWFQLVFRIRLMFKICGCEWNFSKSWFAASHDDEVVANFVCLMVQAREKGYAELESASVKFSERVGGWCIKSGKYYDNFSSCCKRWNSKLINNDIMQIHAMYSIDFANYVCWLLWWSWRVVSWEVRASVSTFSFHLVTIPSTSFTHYALTTMFPRRLIEYRILNCTNMPRKCAIWWNGIRVDVASVKCTFLRYHYMHECTNAIIVIFYVQRQYNNDYYLCMKEMAILHGMCYVLHNRPIYIIPSIL